MTWISPDDRRQMQVRCPDIHLTLSGANLGKTLLFSRTVNGLTNIWKYSLKDKGLTQVTSGTGPDTSPMPDPGGKGIYFVNGKSTGFLTAYNVRSKQFTDIASENATQPAISPDGKRVMYVTIPESDRSELWASNIDGSGGVRLATGDRWQRRPLRPTAFTLHFWRRKLKDRIEFMSWARTAAVVASLPGR